MRPISMLVVDDNQKFLDFVARCLRRLPQAQVAACARSGCVALDELARRPIDLVLLDIGLPDISGLEMIRLIKAQSLAPRVIILTLYDIADYRAAVAAAGADGFVAKTDLASCLLPTISGLFAEPMDQQEIRSLAV